MYTVDFQNLCQFKQQYQSRKRQIRRSAPKNMRRKGVAGIPVSAPVPENDLPEIARYSLRSRKRKR